MVLGVLLVYSALIVPMQLSFWENVDPCLGPPTCVLSRVGREVCLRASARVRTRNGACGAKTGSSDGVCARAHAHAARASARRRLRANCGRLRFGAGRKARSKGRDREVAGGVGRTGMEERWVGAVRSRTKLHSGAQSMPPQNEGWMSVAVRGGLYLWAAVGARTVSIGAYVVFVCVCVL